jgi:hypothetical protein
VTNSPLSSSPEFYTNFEIGIGIFCCFIFMIIIIRIKHR